MSAVLQQDEITNSGTVNDKPVVIIGAGPAGLRAAEELFSLMPDARIVIYGDEPWMPYDRVRLSSLLNGEIETADIFSNSSVVSGADRVEHRRCPVVKINADDRYVIDTEERCQPFSELVIATGSRAHIPNIPGIELNGIYTFRDMADTQLLMARKARSRRTIILGAGLLGIETARAMQKMNTEVFIIDHANRLMPRQLDEDASLLLMEEMLGYGIKMILGTGIKTIMGDYAVEAVELHNGKTIKCDTVILSTGITPNTSLALEAGLSVGRGIRVNDQMQTSKEGIYAIGECCEHNEKVYGLVAPCLDQASVAANNIAKPGKNYSFSESIAATNLKVVDIDVFSMGRVGEEENESNFNYYIYNRPDLGLYRKIVLRNKRIVGVISVGAWADTPRVQEAIDAGRLLWPWQILRFMRSGLIWSAETGNDVSKWPASARICNCTGATVGDVTSLINGSNDLEAVCRESGASTVCGSCRPFVEQLFTGGSKAARYPVVMSLGILSLLALAVSVAWLALSPVDQPPGWSDGFRLTDLWNNGLYKQISGFTLIGIVMLGLYVSVKKRLLKSNRRYSLFRNIHVATGLTAVLILLAHTGASMGNNLDYLLMFSFMLAAVVGGMSGLVTSSPSMLGNRMGSRVRSFMSFIHILTVWPIPVVLVFHVLSSYYY